MGPTPLTWLTLHIKLIVSIDNPELGRNYKIENEWSFPSIHHEAFLSRTWQTKDHQEAQNTLSLEWDGGASSSLFPRFLTTSLLP